MTLHGRAVVRAAVALTRPPLRTHTQHAHNRSSSRIARANMCAGVPAALSSARPAATVAVLARRFARTAGRRFLARHSTSPAALLARRSARSPLCAHPALLALRAPPRCSHRHVPAPPGSSTASCSHDRCSPRRLAWRRSVTSQRAPHATHAAHAIVEGVRTCFQRSRDCSRRLGFGDDKTKLRVWGGYVYHAGMLHQSVWVKSPTDLLL